MYEGTRLGFLASSFAFIAPIIYGVKNWGIPETMCGLAAAGVVYIIISFIVRAKGSSFLEKYLPPIVVGPVIMVIGMILAPVAINMAIGKTGDGAVVLVPQGHAIVLAVIALGTTIIISMLGSGFLRVVPILGGLIVGYIAALLVSILWIFCLLPKPRFLPCRILLRPNGVGRQSFLSSQ